MAGIRHILGEGGLTKFDALVLAPDTSNHDLEFYCLNCHERPRIGILRAIRSLRSFMNSTIFSPGGSLTSVAERTGFDMQYAVLTQDFADRPSPPILQAVLARAPSRTGGLLSEEQFRCQSINCSSLLVKPRDHAKLRCTPLNVVWSLSLFVP